MTASIIIANYQAGCGLPQFDVIHSLNRVITNRIFFWRDKVPNSGSPTYHSFACVEPVSAPET